MKKAKYEFPEEIVKRNSIISTHIDFVNSIKNDDLLSDNEWNKIKDITGEVYPEMKKAKRKSLYKGIDRVHEKQRLNAVVNVRQYDNEDLRNHLVFAHFVSLIKETATQEFNIPIF